MKSSTLEELEPSDVWYFRLTNDSNDIRVAADYSSPSSDYIVCVSMHMSSVFLLSGGSSDIPLHNKSAVCLTIPSLCACGPGAREGIFSLYQTHPLASFAAWMVSLLNHAHTVGPFLSFLRMMSTVLKYELQMRTGGRKWASSSRHFFYQMLLSGTT